MTEKVYAFIGLVILAGGGYWFWTYSQQAQIYTSQQQCASKLASFQERRTAEQAVANKEDIFAMEYADGSIVAPKVYDFFVGYSPTLHTCVGGDTLATSERVDASSDMRDFYYTYTIIDLDTNDLIDSYNTVVELVKHRSDPANSNLTEITQVDAAGQYAWNEYRARLTELTAGQIH